MRLLRDCAAPAVLALVLVGCGSPAPAAAPAPDSAASPQGADPTAGMTGMDGMDHGSGGAHGSAQRQLWAVQTGALGVVVGDEAGYLLYRSDRDSADPPTSRCDAACTAQWPPVTVPAGVLPEALGVDPAAVGTLTRDDGSVQLTLAGWPLYRHAGDRDGYPDAGANGADGVWFVVTPQGGRAGG